MQPEEENFHTYPPKIQGHLDDKVGGGYHEEVPRRILRHGPQHRRDLGPSDFRSRRKVNDQRKREEVCSIQVA